ncbi:MAG: hypothetical protein US51_C0018G0005 [Microgenomates group bacterium GW2011_GWA2_37_6]|nr:MAG: hypothetical protein US51_C0018G0005 [Microgenomates group bacterium GW2011_GWA2_37_6]
MKISFITTVFNEEKTIAGLLESLDSQTKIPDEVIIVDGGSSDRTVAEIKNHPFGKLRTRKSKIKNINLFKILVKKGNRSIGRNEAIKNATGDIIVCTDAGCVLDKNWIRNIIKPFENKKVDVVAGYYKGLGETFFEKSLVPYVLVMNDRVDPKNFLPATRSMAFKKSIWEKIGGFDEKLSHNEDYVFSQKLKKVKANIKFAKNAIVFWEPRKNAKEAFIMFFRFALGDAETGIFRPKVILIFGRYITGLFLLNIYFFTDQIFIAVLILILLINYILWSILKNYRYVRNSKAIFYLPLLQFLSDFAVITGTVSGFISRLGKRS